MLLGRAAIRVRWKASPRPRPQGPGALRALPQLSTVFCAFWPLRVSGWVVLPSGRDSRLRARVSGKRGGPRQGLQGESPPCPSSSSPHEVLCGCLIWQDCLGPSDLDRPLVSRLPSVWPLFRLGPASSLRTRERHQCPGPALAGSPGTGRVGSSVTTVRRRGGRPPIDACMPPCRGSQLCVQEVTHIVLQTHTRLGCPLVSQGPGG